MRRSISLIALGAVAGLVLAGCSNSDDGKGVEVFTWWTSDSEEIGLNALVEVLGDKYPDVKFINGSVTGSGGSGKDKLQTRLANNQPPDTFQAHAGAEVMDYIEAGQVQDVSNLYSEFGLDKAFPADLLDLVTKDGKKYSIPSNVHRANILWASAPVLQAVGIDPGNINYPSIDAFIADLDKIKQANPDIV
ncbi:MAG: ABC transporter substrate-binding protein, partial [Micrococcales bacterium]|nr:ABC transporter substrate-binding protein [Micrococcales bacterium]